MFHKEGGWSADINADDKISMKRFRRKKEKGDMADSVKNLGAVVSLEVKQNNTVNIYENYFDDEVADHSSVPPSAKGMALLKDPSEVKRTVTCVDWHMEGSSRIAVSYSITKFQDPRLMMKNLPSQSYIWDVQKPNSPESAIEPDSPGDQGK